MQTAADTFGAGAGPLIPCITSEDSSVGMVVLCLICISIMFLYFLPSSTTDFTFEVKGVPQYLGLAFVMVTAYALGRVIGVLFKVLFKVSIAPVISYLILGFLLSHYDVMSSDLSAGIGIIKVYAFFIVLARAGLEIEPSKINLATLLLGTLPCMCDATAIGIGAMLIRDFTFIEGLALGFVMAPLGDGLVIPAISNRKYSSPLHATV